MFKTLDPNGIYDVYLRKSRADAELEKLKKFDTLKQHEKLLKERAEQLNIKIHNFYKEVVSGESIQDRPEIQKLLKKVETGKIDGVLVVEIERLTRGDAKDQGIVAQTFKYSNTKIITLNKIYDPNSDEDEEYFEFGLFMSRREYKTINRRMQRGRLANVLEGKYCASEPPLGYKKVRVKYGKGYTLEPILDEANIVKEIFKKRLEGLGCDNICNWLNTLEIKPRRSDVWTPSTVKSILSNPIYIGKIRWNYNKRQKMLINGQIIKKRKKSSKDDLILVEGLHPAIIEEKLFNIVQETKTNKASTKHNNELQNPLATLIKCAYCGRSMQRRPYCESKNKTSKLKRKYDVDIEKLRLFLRNHKGNYSCNDIARSLKISKNIVNNWFANSNDRFTIPYAEKWEELKKILKIETTEFDREIMTLEKNDIVPHEDTLICTKSHCANIGSNLSLVEEKVISGLEVYINTQKELLSAYNPSENDNSNIIPVLNKNLDTYNKQLNKAYELVESGIYTPEEFTKRTKIIKDKINSLEKEINKCQPKINKTKIEKLLPKMEDVVKYYWNLDSAEKKNKLLKSVISYIEYVKIKGGRGYEDNFTITIHPKI